MAQKTTKKAETKKKSAKPLASKKKVSQPPKKSSPVKSAASKSKPADKSSKSKKTTNVKKESPTKKESPAKKKTVAVKKTAPVKSEAPAKKKTAAVSTPATRKVIASGKVAASAEKPKLSGAERIANLRLKQAERSQAAAVKKTAKSLSAKDLEFFQDLLLLRRREILGDISRLESETVDNDAGQQSADVLEDGSSATFEQDIAFELLQGDSDKVRKIDLALERVEQKTYGICVDCDERIPQGRLKYMPWVIRCVPCKEKYEMYLAEQ
ncbi:MAG: TraR/DksA C4-type zinc finger protein [Planctomycetes bacterium]|nr:TraR/DksA C4-type zinc finger protein [Planctomycetota bacterium]